MPLPPMKLPYKLAAALIGASRQHPLGRLPLRLQGLLELGVGARLQQPLQRQEGAKAQVKVRVERRAPAAALGSMLTLTS